MYTRALGAASEFGRRRPSQHVLNGYMGIEARMTRIGARKAWTIMPPTRSAWTSRMAHPRPPPALDRGVGAVGQRRGRLRGAGGVGRRPRGAGGIRVHGAVAPGSGGAPGRPAGAGAGEPVAPPGASRRRWARRRRRTRGRSPRWAPRWRCGAWSRARSPSATSTSWRRRATRWSRTARRR